jgi:two-component system alkaline phosphatase synthesis response regulator PhoP
MSKAHILLVDDEEDILELMGYNLEQEGYGVTTARNGLEALEIAEKIQPDLIVLDIMMPGMDGIEVCERLRQNAHLRLTPILMLTARTEEEDEISGLESGADDYVQKPVSPELIVSRIEALLRRDKRSEKPPNIVEVHDLVIDRDRYLVEQQSTGQLEQFELPRKEFELLYFLASHPGKVFSRQELLDNVWGPEVFVVDRTVDVHIRKIREKLGSHYIETVKGVGYRFME